MKSPGGVCGAGVASQNRYAAVIWNARGGCRLNTDRYAGLYSWFAPVFHCVYAPVLNTLKMFNAGSNS